MTTLSCFAVDDEPLALGLVGAFIKQTPFLHLSGAYGSAVAALRALHAPAAEPVDLLFLDIQMPDLNGLELARVLAARGGPTPRIIFTTAFNQFALEGFRVDALDYLLKPFSYEEFLHAAEKARTWFELVRRAAPAPADALAPVAATVAEPVAAASSSLPTLVSAEALFLRVEYQLVRVDFDDILYLEGLKDYVKVYRRSEPRPLLSLTSLKALEDKLPADRFLRLHRSYIVALERITALTRNSVQVGGVTIAVSPQYKDDFQRLLDRWT
jgi:two-component system, LytTR family, response regulator LytT